MSNERKGFLNKSSVTNIISLLIIGVGFVLPDQFGKFVLTVGLFSFSGAVTNWLAIHMLFEKVPGLYGSGVVPLHFQDFKRGIHDLILGQFFTKENLERFLADNAKPVIEIETHKIGEVLEIDSMFDSLIEVIKNSPFGGMINMFGGEEALQPLREPFVKAIHAKLQTLFESEKFKTYLAGVIKSAENIDELENKISQIVNKRLDELTPKKVKEIVQDMIEEHLGWLVIWGGFFGGIMGIITAIINTI